MAHLKAYLETAIFASNADVPSDDSKPQQAEQIQETIAAALRAQELEVELDYGLSEFVVDIAVRAPGSSRWQVAVMLDGPRWARRTTVADRELTPSLLDSIMGWSSCERVWLPEWIKDQQAVVERIAAAVERAVDEDAKRAQEDAQRAEHSATAKDQSDDRVADTSVATIADLTSSTEPADTAPFVEPVHTEHLKPVAYAASSATALSPVSDRGVRVPYKAAPTDPVGSRDELDHPQWESVRNRIQDAVRESVAIEGPIALNRLIRNVVHRFGFDRAAAKRQQVVRQFVPEDLIYEDEMGSFVWPTDLDRTEWNGFRTTPSGFFRPLDEVAGEEIINALVYAARNGVDDQEALMRDTLAYFDQSRLTKQSADRLEQCISRAERLGRLIRRGAGYVSAT